MQIAPLKPTWQRYKKLAFSKLSLLRELEYERVPLIKLHGRVLDVGGGRNVGYLPLLHGYETLESINIGEKYAPTLLADANKPWAIADETYDCAISLNTFEHLEKDRFALSELVRVLKTGADFHIVVPYLYRVHGSPYDYHRHTAAGWASLLQEAGIDPATIQIQPLVWDSLSTAFSFIEMSRLRFLKPLIMLAGWWRMRRVAGDTVPEPLATAWADLALGYYITGKK